MAVPESVAASITSKLNALLRERLEQATSTIGASLLGEDAAADRKNDLDVKHLEKRFHKSRSDDKAARSLVINKNARIKKIANQIDALHLSIKTAKANGRSYGSYEKELKQLTDRLHKVSAQAHSATTSRRDSWRHATPKRLPEQLDLTEKNSAGTIALELRYLESQLKDLNAELKTTDAKEQVQKRIIGTKKHIEGLQNTLRNKKERGE